MLCSRGGCNEIKRISNLVFLSTSYNYTGELSPTFSPYLWCLVRRGLRSSCLFGLHKKNNGAGFLSILGKPTSFAIPNPHYPHFSGFNWPYDAFGFLTLPLWSIRLQKSVDEVSQTVYLYHLQFSSIGSCSHSEQSYLPAFEVFFSHAKIAIILSDYLLLTLRFSGLLVLCGFRI